MEDKDLVKKIAAIPAEAHLAPKGFFVRKLKPHEISEKKRLKRIDVFKIIRVTCPQGMFEFAIPDKMLVQDLEEKMKEKLYEERLSEAKASTASATKELGDKDEQDKSKEIDTRAVEGQIDDPFLGKELLFQYRGQTLTTTMVDVEAGESVVLFIRNRKKPDRSVCRTLFTCTCGRY
mmetsp:Transcript_5362/g.13074  ORF Transcript_5362/g.13074 Transcript_5362/m.13074 type:complete len:177 (+) Transcript_5362:132-662(+)